MLVGSSDTGELLARNIARSIAGSRVHDGAIQGQKWVPQILTQHKVPAVSSLVACSGGSPELGGGASTVYVHVPIKLRCVQSSRRKSLSVVH